MAPHILILSKVIGTVSLGILAGATASTNLVSLSSVLLKQQPEIVENPDSTNFLLDLYQTTVTKIVIPLSTIAFGSLISAYIFAPPHARHPYLIYSALSIPIINSLDYFYGPSGIINLDNVIGSLCSCTSVVSSRFRCSKSSSSAPPAVKPIPDIPAALQPPQPPVVAKSIVETDEPSLLDNSVYAHLENPNTPATTSSDIDFSSTSSDTPSPEEQSEDELASTVHPSTVSISTSQLHSNLSKLSLYSTVVFHLAFLISTIGIYGDLS